MERDEKKRANFLKLIADDPRDRLVFVDESGIESFLHSPYAWSKRGKRVYGPVSGRRYARESFVAAKCGSRILAPFCYQGTCNTELFNLWVERFLLPELKTGQMIIMDNATFHKSERTKTLIESVGCTLLFLPPYSPDLNPIEVFWANFKEKVRSFIELGTTLQSAIDHAFQMYNNQLE